MVRNTIKTGLKSNKVTIRLSDDEFYKITKMAQINQVSVSDQIRRIIRSIKL